MWELATPWWEIAARIMVIYLGLMALVRISGKRQISDLTPMDLLTVLIISEIVSPALTAGDESVTAALLGSAVLFGITAIISLVSYRWPRVERLLEGEPQTLIYRGALDRRVMRSERITDQDLQVALHQNGVESIEEVRLAMVEPNGHITMVKYQD